MAKVVLIVGKPRTGKTSFLKNVVKKCKNSYVNDINLDFKNCNSYENPEDIDGFINSCTYVRNSNIIIDEATIYFSNRGYSKGLTRLLILKAHSNNNYYLVFHSINAIPKPLLVYSDVVILFKTNDLDKDVVNKLGAEVYKNNFLKIKKSKNQHFFNIIKF